MAQSKEQKAAVDKAYHERNKEKRNAKSRAYKEANKEKIAAVNKAYREANKEKIAAVDKAYREVNKDVVAAGQKAWREANKDWVRVRQKDWYEDNKVEILIKKKAYYEVNKNVFKERYKNRKKAYREANREAWNLYRRAYYRNNKASAYASNAKRRALKLKQIPIHLRDCPHEKQRLRQIYKLRNIISEATGVQHHVDHMWPLADGGPHWSGNLQVIPAAENLRKNASVCEDTKATIIKSLYTFESESAI